MTSSEPITLSTGVAHAEWYPTHSVLHSLYDRRVIKEIADTYRAIHVICIEFDSWCSGCYWIWYRRCVSHFSITVYVRHNLCRREIRRHVWSGPFHVEVLPRNEGICKSPNLNIRVSCVLIEMPQK